MHVLCDALGVCVVWFSMDYMDCNVGDTGKELCMKVMKHTVKYGKVFGVKFRTQPLGPGKVVLSRRP